MKKILAALAAASALLFGAAPALANGLNLTAIGTVTYGTGASGFNQDFDAPGDGAQTSTYTEPNSAFTLEARINAGTTNPGGLGVFMGEVNQAWVGVYTNGLLAYSCFSSGGVVATQGTVTDGAWHHVELDLNGSSCTLYVDGVASGTQSYSYTSSGGNFTYGQYQGGYIYYGQIDEAVIWSAVRHTAAFTPPTSPYTGSETNQVALYHFDNNLNDSNTSGGSGGSGLAIGGLSASAGSSSITLSLTAGLSGGSGSGYQYEIFRGTDPNFTEGTPLATVSSMPYVDSSVSPNTQYWYGVTGIDNASNSAAALPNGVTGYTNTQALYVSAALNVQDLNIVYIGDSRTYCLGCSANGGTVTGNTPPYWADVQLGIALNLRKVNGYNGGVSGATTANWIKGATTDYSNAAGVGGTTGMQALVTADSSALKVFSIMLDANDANGGVTASTYQSNMSSIIASLLSDWPGCYVIVHQGSYFTPNTYGGNASASLDYSYRAATAAAVNANAATHPGHVFLGDTLSYNYFAQNYYTQMLQQNEGSPLGYYYVHQNDTGAQSLGRLWANAITQDLYAAVAPRTFTPTFH